MRKVLIVDDDTIIRITLRSLINWEEMGFQIVADAIHGEAALAYLKPISSQLMRERRVIRMLSLIHIYVSYLP